MQTALPRLPLPFVALLAVAACAIGICAFGAVESSAVGRYVAFGDSNATGSGLDSSNASPCYRTPHRYPAFSATALGISDFVSVACSGAGINEFTNPFAAAGNTPPQFNSLLGSETLVTLTIGDNDSGYGVYVNACL